MEVIVLFLQSPCIGQVRARRMKAWIERVRAVFLMMECLWHRRGLHQGSRGIGSKRISRKLMHLNTVRCRLVRSGLEVLSQLASWVFCRDPPKHIIGRLCLPVGVQSHWIPVSLNVDTVSARVVTAIIVRTMGMGLGGGAVVVIFVCRIGPLVLRMDRLGMVCILRTIALGLRQVFLLKGNTAVLEEAEGFFLL